MGRLKELGSIYPFAVSLLTRAIRENKVSNAYLFEGYGVRKFDVAVRFAQALLCEQEIDDGCGRCKDCRFVASGKHPSVRITRLAGRSFIVKDAKEIEEFVLLPPEKRYRVVIVDWIEKFSQEAINSLLKIIEEPSEGVVFVITVPVEFSLPETVVSRCQTVSFYSTKEEIDGIYGMVERLLHGTLREEDVLSLAAFNREQAKLLLKWVVEKLVKSKRVELAGELVEMGREFDIYNLNVQLFLNSMVSKLLEV